MPPGEFFHAVKETGALRRCTQCVVEVVEARGVVPGPADSTEEIVDNVLIGVDAQASLDCQKGARHCIETAQLELTLSLQCGKRFVHGV